MASGISGKLSPDHFVPFGSASVTTTAQTAWQPATGKSVRFMGGAIGLMTAGTVQVDILDGTVAAAGTIYTVPLENPGNPTYELDLWAGKLLGAVDRPLGIKVRAGAGTIAATWEGREV